VPGRIIERISKNKSGEPVHGRGILNIDMFYS